jgi:arylsulfatase A-like enzyme
MKYFSFSTRVKRTFYVGCFVLGLLMLCSGFIFKTTTKKPAKSSKPNIIIMLLDDAGYADFGFMGSKDLQTPNIDKLASSAIRFTDAHVSASVCSPSRAGLLTGKYQQRFGYECNEGDGYTGMDTAQTLLPKLLQQQGYATAAFGKWHLGFEPGQHPLQKGFQYYYGFLSGGRSYFYMPNKDDSKGAKSALFENYQQTEFDGYLTDVLGDKAVSYIKENKHHPFFMYWAPNAVHTPMEASKADLEKFANHPRQKLAAMTFALDRAIGKIVDELKKQGLFENTIIVFLSDNGGAHNNQSSNHPLKGFKGNKYEGGIRVPFFISWPKEIKGGTKYEGLISSLDVFPTALAAAGGTGKEQKSLDGVNLLPFLKGKKPDNPHQELAWRKDAEAGFRFNQYKLIRISGAGERLYDLSKDPGETNDLQFSKPEVLSMLKNKLIIWEKDKMKPLWTEGAMWDTITLMIHDDLMHNRKVRVRNPEELKNFRLNK